MGLMDRDYMQERHRRRETQPHRGETNGWTPLKIIGWTAVIGTAVFFSAKYFIRLSFGIPFPLPGQVLWYINPPVAAGSKLTIKAPLMGDELYAVSIDEAGTGRRIGLVPLRKGEVARLTIPLGAYHFLFASGTTWYGPIELFGVTGKRSKTTAPLHFYRVGNQTLEHTIDLTQRVNGNLPTRALIPFEK
jgi:hypothetical protein